MPRIRRMLWVAMALTAALIAVSGRLRAEGGGSVAGDGRMERVRAIEAEFDVALRQASALWSRANADPQKRAAPSEGPNIEDYAARLLALAQERPDDAASREGLTWIIQRAGYTPKADEALTLLARAQAADPTMGQLCPVVASFPSPAAGGFLRAVLERNPGREARGQACFALGLHWKSRAEIARALKGEDESGPIRRGWAQRRGPAFVRELMESSPEEALAESERCFERAQREFADLAHWRGNVGKAAEDELFEIHHLTVGKTAPEIEGRDLDGKPLRLSSFAGKIVVIDFTTDECAACRSLYAHERSLVERLKAKPFALVGVQSGPDLNKLRQVIESEKIPWSSWWDGAQGPISTRWNVRAWPTIYVLDHRGVIRFKDVNGKQLDQAVDQLVDEVENPMRME